MQIDQVIAILGTSVTTVATVTLAYLTWKYVKFTRELVEEARSSKQPNVFVDFEIENSYLKIVISNNGGLPAADIRFEAVESITWDNMYAPHSGLDRVEAIKNGISYLAPGRFLKFFVGRLASQNDASDQPNKAQIKIDFRAADSSNRFSRIYDVDLAPYINALEESFKGPQHEVAKAIESSERSRKSSEHMSRSRSRFANFGKRACPHCYEAINPKATKCPHCQERITNTESDEAPST